MARRRKKRPMEFKKKLLVWAVVATSVCIAADYILSACGLEPPSGVSEAMITTCIGSIIAYCLATYGEKNSRNKYGLDRNGNPRELNNDEIGG